MHVDTSPYIELDRRFQEFDESEDQLSTEGLRIPRQSLNHGKRWSELLANRFVVVLGEAGTGKTREFRKQASALNDKAKIRFLYTA